MSGRHRDYHETSGYRNEPSGIRRLDYIVSAANVHMENTGRVPRVLEVGCGNGNISITLASLGFDVTAIDVDEGSIALARKNTPAGVRVDFRVESAEALADSNDKEAYDIVICTEVLEHLSDPVTTTRTFPAHTKENGIVIITVPNGRCLEEKLRRFLVFHPAGKRLRRILRKRLIREEHVQSSNVSSTHIQYFRLDEMKTLIDESGLKINSVVNSSVFFREVYYVFLRLFLKRGSWLFRKLDDLDDYLSERVGNNLASGWFFLCTKK
jgi:2-polyprenyl-3-methyl-5-hydroxy-6-metoxy-1,4-benzoquinol methylase